jgi:hypothetical protein
LEEIIDPGTRAERARLADAVLGTMGGFGTPGKSDRPDHDHQPAQRPSRREADHRAGIPGREGERGTEHDDGQQKGTRPSGEPAMARLKSLRALWRSRA